MVLGLLSVAALLAAPLHSDPYFTGLKRPRVERVQIDRAGGPVILVVVDALRPDRMSAYGASRPTTPVLDKLADEGVLLTNYFVNGNWTRPSTASLLTGLLPSVHAVERDSDRLRPEIDTLAELLREKGIPTGAVVGNGNAASAFGLAQGFDTFADTVKHWKGLPTADEVIDLALPFVDQHAGKPFFLMLFLIDPHDPYHAPGEYETMFVRDPAVPLIRTPHWEIGKYSRADIDRMLDTYDGAIRYTDAALGRFFEALKKRGLYDDATIMVTADHGEAFGEHGVFMHAHHLYDEIVRAPFILKAKKMSARGGVSPLLMQSVDVLPTLAASFGATVPEGLVGLDMFAALANPKMVNPDRVVISEFGNFGIKRAMLRTLTQKVILQLPADEEQFKATVGKKSLLPSVSFDQEVVQLFDVAKDPREQKDLYSAKTAQEKRWAELVRTLRSYMRERSEKTLSSIVGPLDPETMQDLRSLGYIQ